MFSKTKSNDNDSGIVENSSFDYEDDRPNVSYYENISPSKLISPDYGPFTSKSSSVDSALNNVSTNESENELLSKINAYKNYYDGLINESLMVKSYSSFRSNSSFNKLSDKVFDLYQDNSLLWSRNDMIKADSSNNTLIKGFTNSSLRSNLSKYKYLEDPYENHVYENSYNAIKMKPSDINDEINDEKPIDYSLSNNDKINNKHDPSKLKSSSVNSEKTSEINDFDVNIILLDSIKNNLNNNNLDNQERNITPKAQSYFDKGVPKTKKIWREKYIAEDENNVVISNIKNLEACVTAINHTPLQNNLTENSLTPKLIEELKTFRSFINEGTDSMLTNYIKTAEKKQHCNDDVIYDVISTNNHIEINSINDNNFQGEQIYNDYDQNDDLLSNDCIKKNISDIISIENSKEISSISENIESNLKVAYKKNLKKSKLDFIINPETCLFHCSHCSYGAVKKTQLRRHLGIHKIFICTHCGENFEVQSLLADHIRIDHPNRSGRKMCKKCNMLFRAEDLDSHLDNCTGIKVGWDCKICSKNFKFLSTLSIHMEKWHKDIAENENLPNRIIVENDCLKSSQKYNFPKDDISLVKIINENRSSTNDTKKISFNYENIDSPNFHEKNNLEKPKMMNIKRMIKIFNCVQCSKNYKSKQSLEKHCLSKHGGVSISSKSVIEVSVPNKEKVEVEIDPNLSNNSIKYAKHVCKLFNCFRKFHSLERLLRHEETHNVEKHEKCDWPGCSKSYLHAENLDIHRQQHTSIKPYKCIQCNLAYWQKCSLRSHQQRMHKNMFVDDSLEFTSQIEKEEASNEKQSNHFQEATIEKIVKKYTCEFCSHILKSNKRLERHLKLKHTDFHSSSSILKDFQINNNLEISIKEYEVGFVENVQVQNQNDEDTIDHLDAKTLSENKPFKDNKIQKDIELPLFNHVLSNGGSLKNIEEVYEFNEKYEENEILSESLKEKSSTIEGIVNDIISEKEEIFDDDDVSQDFDFQPNRSQNLKTYEKLVKNFTDDLHFYNKTKNIKRKGIRGRPSKIAGFKFKHLLLPTNVIDNENMTDNFIDLNDTIFDKNLNLDDDSTNVEMCTDSNFSNFNETHLNSEVFFTPNFKDSIDQSNLNNNIDFTDVMKSRRYKRIKRPNPFKIDMDIEKNVKNEIVNADNIESVTTVSKLSLKRMLFSDIFRSFTLDDEDFKIHVESPGLISLNLYSHMETVNKSNDEMYSKCNTEKEAINNIIVSEADITNQSSTLIEVEKPSQNVAVIETMKDNQDIDNPSPTMPTLESVEDLDNSFRVFSCTPQLQQNEINHPNEISIELLARKYVEQYQDHGYKYHDEGSMQKVTPPETIPTDLPFQYSYLNQQDEMPPKINRVDDSIINESLNKLKKVSELFSENKDSHSDVIKQTPYSEYSIMSKDTNKDKLHADLIQESYISSNYNFSGFLQNAESSSLKSSVPFGMFPSFYGDDLNLPNQLSYQANAPAWTSSHNDSSYSNWNSLYDNNPHHSQISTSSNYIQNNLNYNAKANVGYNAPPPNEALQFSSDNTFHSNYSKYNQSKAYLETGLQERDTQRHIPSFESYYRSACNSATRTQNIHGVHSSRQNPTSHLHIPSNYQDFQILSNYPRESMYGYPYDLIQNRPYLYPSIGPSSSSKLVSGSRNVKHNANIGYSVDGAYPGSFYSLIPKYF